MLKRSVRWGEAACCSQGPRGTSSTSQGTGATQPWLPSAAHWALGRGHVGCHPGFIPCSSKRGLQRPQEPRPMRVLLESHQRQMWCRVMPAMWVWSLLLRLPQTVGSPGTVCLRGSAVNTASLCGGKAAGQRPQVSHPGHAWLGVWGRALIAPCPAGFGSCRGVSLPSLLGSYVCGVSTSALCHIDCFCRDSQLSIPKSWRGLQGSERN